jgi:hypothetical protein
MVLYLAMSDQRRPSIEGETSAEPEVTRSDTISVTIRATPDEVFDFVSDVGNWPEYTDFAPRVEHIAGHLWLLDSPQGPVAMETHFNPEFGLLDATVTQASGEETFIPYRVVPNKGGAELMMTNFKSLNDSDADYREQVGWMRDELDGVKRIVEARKGNS